MDTLTEYLTEYLEAKKRDFPLSVAADGPEQQVLEDVVERLSYAEVLLRRSSHTDERTRLLHQLVESVTEVAESMRSGSRIALADSLVETGYHAAEAAVVYGMHYSALMRHLHRGKMEVLKSD